MIKLLRITTWMIAIVLAFLLLSIIALWWLNRDLPVAELEARYGGANLLEADVLGVPLRYKVEGSGPPVLLIHSHFYSMRMWQPWVDELAGDFTLIRYDLTSTA